MLLRSLRVLQSATPLSAKVKPTTGFVNFPVVSNFQAVLAPLYAQTLEELAKFPAEVPIVACVGHQAIGFFLSPDF